jgi:hypothetical protein
MAKRRRRTAKKSSDRKWIQKAIKRPGAFTEKARRRGMTVAQFAQEVIRNPEKYDTRTVRQAHLAITLRKLAQRRKKRK